MRIGCSGSVNERTGIGVVQAHLYRYLKESGHELVYSQPRDIGRTPSAKLRGLLRGFTKASGAVDVYLSVVPPFPFGVTAPMLTVVHDLRWQRTRSRLGSAYRGWDLHRTVKRSEALLCISENTRRDLIAFDRSARQKASVQWLGPGQIPENSFEESASGVLMMVGGAAHKQNEYAATALAISRPPWVRSVVGVGVSSTVRAILSPIFDCHWYANVSNSEMLSLYKQAQFFIMLGTDEGFGLPFVEALATGCQVIASDHQLAREILGDAGVFVSPSDVNKLSVQLEAEPNISRDIRSARATKFSWQTFSAVCEHQLLALVDRRLGRQP